MKIRGSKHDKKPKEKTLCCEGLYPYARKRRELTSVEITHPKYRFEKVKFVPPYDKEDENPPFPGENWIGIKLICYNINNNKGYHMDFYIDPEPIDFGTGKFNNNWQKVWEYEEGEDDTPIWGGPRCTLRVDMAARLDVAAMNVRSIKAP